MKSVFGNAETRRARLALAAAAIIAVFLAQRSVAVPARQFTSEPEVRIGISQKATHARLTFTGRYRLFKADEPLELRAAADETIQVELYIVSIKQLPSRFHVTLGHFRSYEQAEYILGKIGKIGRLPFASAIAQPKKWQLRFGPFNNITEAQYALDLIQKKGYLDSRIEPENPDIPVLSVYAPDGSLVQLGNKPIVFYPENGRFKLNGREYRGNAEIALDAYGTISVINRVRVDDYLYSVLPREMPASAAPEALKAQAVIARTYLLNNLHRHRIDGFSLCNTTDCQVYGGVDDEAQSAIQAVRATRGQVLTYGGQLANALFHSTCGGRTANYDDIWDGDRPPYLCTVDDGTGWPDTDLSDAAGAGKYLKHDKAYCRTSKYFRWDKTYTREQLLNIIKETIPEFTNNPDLKIKSLNGITVERYAKSGRVQEIRIDTDAGVFHFQKDSIRWVLGNLKSTLFTLEAGGRGGARKYKFTGAGWGHGLGLCQIGAMALARNDKYTYDKILYHYYPGTTLTTLWK